NTVRDARFQEKLTDACDMTPNCVRTAQARVGVPAPVEEQPDTDTERCRESDQHDHGRVFRGNSYSRPAAANFSSRRSGRTPVHSSGAPAAGRVHRSWVTTTDPWRVTTSAIPTTCRFPSLSRLTWTTSSIVSATSSAMYSWLRFGAPCSAR